MLSVPPTPSLAARGEHVARAIALCAFCHGPDLAGRVVIDDPFLGRLYAANLTRGEGGVGSEFEDADWVRAIRFGVRRNGESLLLKPALHLVAISDADLAAVVAYLRQVRPVSRVLPSTRAGPLIRLGMTLGQTPDLLSAPVVDRSREARTRVAIERSREYGAYLVEIGNCRLCHGLDLRGGLHPLARPGEPVPPDLRPNGSMVSWDRDDFAAAMRAGKTPDGRRLDPEFMPWPAYAALTELEIDALWLVLRGS